ncbi:MAG: MlaD family protein [Pseudomonadota bacterium]
METRANTLAVGAFVIVAMIMLAIFVIWLGRTSLNQVSVRYTVYFSESVAGLQEGSRVLFRGVPVGEVSRVGLEPEAPYRADVTVELLAETPVLVGTVAQLSSQGLTGIAQIELIGAPEGGVPLEGEDGQRFPVIPSVPSALGALFTSFPELLEKATVFVDRASAFVSPQNEELLRELTGEMLDIVEIFSGRAQTIGNLVDDSSQLVMNLDGLIAELRVDSARVSDSVDGALNAVTRNADQVASSFIDMSQSISDAADTMDDILEESAPGISDFTTTGLNDISLLVTDLRGLSQDLSRLARRIERNPTEVIFGAGSQGVPVQ